MTEQVVSVGFGKENFATRNLSVRAWQVQGPWSLTQPSKHLKRQGQMQTFPASQYPDINGKMYLDSVRAPDDTIMMIQASRRQTMGAGRVPDLTDAALILRTRTTGPMLNVQVFLPEANESLNGGQFLVFQGRADILSAEESELYGIYPGNAFIEHYMDEYEVGELFKITEISTGTPKQKLEVAQVGDETVVLPARATRRVVRRR